jgi:rhomboid family GlyGly-CTERM serine protease
VGFQRRMPVQQTALPALVLSATCVLLLGLEPGASDWFAYRREAVEAGQWWRLLGGNLVHLGPGHLLLNLAGLWLGYVLLPMLHQGALRYWSFAFGLLGVGIGLWWASPEIAWYVGLSGVLHALFIAGALAEIAAGNREGYAVLAIVLAKLIYEQILGPLPGSEASSGGAVIVDAHLYGAAAGCAAWLLQQGWMRCRA